MSGSSQKRVVVLDRDGTIVVDRHYLADPSQLEFLPGAAEGLRQMWRNGHRLIVITNQSGIGRGLFSLESLHRVNDRLQEMVRQAGAEIAGIYWCPHRPDEQCECRKPKTLLLLQAAADFGFDPRECVVIGDKDSDVGLGQQVGARTVLIAPPHPDGDRPSSADLIAADLLQAAGYVDTLAGTAASSNRNE